MFQVGRGPSQLLSQIHLTNFTRVAQPSSKIPHKNNINIEKF